MDSSTPAARLKAVREALAGGKLEEAVRRAAEVEALEPPAGPRLRALNLHLGATALSLAGRGAEAEEWARRGLRVAIRQAREASLVGPLLGLLGERALAAGRFDRALVCFGHARRWFERGGDANGVAVARGNLALALLRLGRREEARGELVRAATGFTAVGNLREAARTRVILSDLLRENGDLDEARRALAEVAQVAEGHRFADLAVEAGLRLGMACEASGEPAAAEPHYARGLAVVDAAGLGAFRSPVLGRLAELALLDGAGREARLLLLAAQEADRRAGARLREASDLLGLAACELLEAQFTQAEAWLLAADRIYSGAGDPRGLLALGLARARVSLESGDEATAERQFGGVLARAGALGFGAAERAARGSLAALRLQRGQWAGLEAELAALEAETRAHGEGTAAVQVAAMRLMAAWGEERQVPGQGGPDFEELARAGFTALARDVLVMGAFALRAAGQAAPAAARARSGAALLQGAPERRWQDLEAVRRSLEGLEPLWVPLAGAPLEPRFRAGERLRLGPGRGPELSPAERAHLPALVRLALEASSL
jgi:tetratricopeptide (TPR) repeat protein